MNELKTISQIAAELGVTRQAVYQRIKSAELSTRLQPFTVKQNNTKVYTLQGQELIKRAFSSGVNVNCKQAVDSKRQSIDSKLIDKLSEQLQVKDKQIEKLTEQVSTLLQQIDKLTTALQAAQALHGMDKQQAVIDVKERPAAASETSRPASEREPKQKPVKRSRSATQQPHTFFNFIKNGFRRKQ